MVVAYHTHEFQIPTASEAEVAAGTESGKVVTPATIGASTAFATAAQGALADSAVQPDDLSTVATTGDYADLTGTPTLGTAAAANTGDFATAAQGALADSALQSAAIGSTIQAYDADLSAIAALAKTDGNFIVGDGSTWVAEDAATARISLDLAFVDNYSMPASPDPVVIYIKSTGTDTITGPEHGTTEGSAFLTFDAAVNHAKKYYRFIGKLNTVTFKFEGGIDWGYIALGSNLDQGEDSFPFTIKITSISDASRAEFTGISLGTWHPNYLYATQIKAGYFAVTRRNAMTVNDVSLISTVTVSYAFRAAFGGKMNIFGDIDFEDVVTYATALIYNQDMGYVSLENGDTPLTFPECNFTNLANVTTPYVYRMVLGSGIYCPSQPYTDLQSLSSGAYYVDSTSYSTQTQSGTDLDNNAASGGPVVTRSGTDTSGWEKFADGKFKQWGILAISSAAVGQTSPGSGALTFPVAFGANPRIKYNWSVPPGGDVSVNAVAPSTTGVQFVVTNRGASAASFNIYWEASGSV